MTTEHRLRRVLAETLGLHDLDDLASINLRDDCGADSLTLVELLMDVEDAFAIEITDDEAIAALGEHGDQPLSGLVALVERVSGEKVDD